MQSVAQFQRREQAVFRPKYHPLYTTRPAMKMADKDRCQIGPVSCSGYNKKFFLKIPTKKPALIGCCVIWCALKGEINLKCAELLIVSTKVMVY